MCYKRGEGLGEGEEARKGADGLGKKGLGEGARRGRRARGGRRGYERGWTRERRRC